MSKPAFARGAHSLPSPIVWAISIVIVLVFTAVSYKLVVDCQPSHISLVNTLKVDLGGCTLPAQPPTDPAPKPEQAITVVTPVRRSEMPCRWAWVYLGRYSHKDQRYELSPGFRFLEDQGPTSPFPKSGDKIVLTAQRSLILKGYGSATEQNKCGQMLSAPWGYQPGTAKDYEAGTLPSNTAVLVNKVTLMPSATAEPTYVWALVGAEN